MPRARSLHVLALSPAARDPGLAQAMDAGLAARLRTTTAHQRLLRRRRRLLRDRAAAEGGAGEAEVEVRGRSARSGIDRLPL